MAIVPMVSGANTYITVIISELQLKVDWIVWSSTLKGSSVFWKKQRKTLEKLIDSESSNKFVIWRKMKSALSGRVQVMKSLNSNHSYQIIR